MAVEPFEFGDAMVGLIADGIRDTPYVSGVLTYDEKKGVRVEVPYHPDPSIEQYSTERGWFSGEELPTNVEVKLQKGEVSLFDCHRSRTTENIMRGWATGEIAAHEVVLRGRDGEQSDQLTVKQVRSHIDGLSEWTRFSSVKQTHETDDNAMIKKLTIEVETVDTLSWKHGDATLTLTSHWIAGSPDEGTQIQDSIVLESEFDEPRPFADHIAEQRKVVQLMSLLFGCGIRFRRHLIRDERFPFRMGDGSTLYLPYVETYSDSTRRDISEPKPTRAQLTNVIARVQTLGVEGLERWGAINEDWNRVILPMVGVLGRLAFVEDVVVNAAMSLEAAGQILGVVEGEEKSYHRGNPTTATWMYRCVYSLRLDWSGIAESPMAVGRGIANFYNDIKHYGRGEFPDPEETYLIRIVAAVVVRLTVMNAVDSTGETAKVWGQRWVSGEAFQQYMHRSLFLGEKGRFVPRPS